MISSASSFSYFRFRILSIKMLLSSLVSSNFIATWIYFLSLKSPMWLNTFLTFFYMDSYSSVRLSLYRRMPRLKLEFRLFSWRLVSYSKDGQLSFLRIPRYVDPWMKFLVSFHSSKCSLKFIKILEDFVILSNLRLI